MGGLWERSSCFPTTFQGAEPLSHPCSVHATLCQLVSGHLFRSGVHLAPRDALPHFLSPLIGGVCVPLLPWSSTPAADPGGGRVLIIPPRSYPFRISLQATWGTGHVQTPLLSRKAFVRAKELGWEQITVVPTLSMKGQDLSRGFLSSLQMAQDPLPWRRVCLVVLGRPLPSAPPPLPPPSEPLHKFLQL